ncbi:MAG: ABC transporter permease subunit [Acidimicrobiia bacterium]|nr:ABC transporter permease subunit [Acidimicrobiia bacterium]
MVAAAAQRRETAGRRRIQTGLAVAGALVVFSTLWEVYKLLGGIIDDRWPDILPVRPDNLTMPHVWEIAGSFIEPVQRGRSEILAMSLLKAAGFTLIEAGLGFLIGTVVGLGLAVLMLRSFWLDRALVPWINISQTVPLIALAPIVVTWGRTTFLGDTVSVALIAAYLTFFPVAVNGLAGLKSPAPEALELMRSYAAGWSKTLFALRLPAARPYLFPAFKLAATLSVVGAIVGEISAGIRGGLGRVILDYAGRYTTGPEKLYAAVIAAALLGLFVFGMANLAEARILRGENQES